MKTNRIDSTIVSALVASVLGLGALACGTQTSVCKQCGLAPNRSYVLILESGATVGRTSDANGCVSYSCLTPPSAILDPVTNQTFHVEDPGAS